MTKEEIKALMFTTVEAWNNSDKKTIEGELCGYDDDESDIRFRIKKENGSHTWKEFIKPTTPKKTIPMTAKTCPRRPVLRHKWWVDGMEVYPNIALRGLRYYSNDGVEFITWAQLADQENKWTQGDGSPWTVEVDE